MRMLIVTAGLLALSGLASSASLTAADPKDKETSANKLVGTWKIVSAKYGGQEAMLPQDTTTVKHITPNQYMWASYGKDGQVYRAAGGPYTFNGEVMESTPEYGFGADFESIKGKRQSYKCRVEGNKWYQSGTLSTGTNLEEVWERVEMKKK
jgi:hypothetical protein